MRRLRVSDSPRVRRRTSWIVAAGLGLRRAPARRRGRQRCDLGRRRAPRCRGFPTCKRGERSDPLSVKGPPGAAARVPAGPQGDASEPPAGRRGPRRGGRRSARVRAASWPTRNVDLARSSGNIVNVAKVPLTASVDIVAYCFDLDAAPRSVERDDRGQPRHVRRPTTRPATRCDRALQSTPTVDRALARTWGCAQGTEAAVVMPGGGSPFYVVFDYGALEEVGRPAVAARAARGARSPRARGGRRRDSPT